MLGQFALLLAVLLAGFWFDGWPVESNLALTLLGGAVGVVGLGLFVAAILAHGGAVTPLPRPREPVRLVESGAYRFVRHPIYGGVILLAAGFALWRASLVALLFVVGLGLLFHRKARLEEDWLIRLAPEYEDYRRRVRREFVPFVF